MWVRALLVMAPLVAVLGAAPVQASGAAAPKITPANGSVITSSSVTVRVKTATGGGTLYVDGRKVGSGKNTVLTYRIDGRTEPNGTHTVRLDALIPWDTADSTFRMAVPALRPSGLSVASSGKKVTVQWNKGAEPDLTGYTVSGDLGTKNVSIGACGARCSVTFASSGTASGRATVSVVAKRSGAQASGAASRTVKVNAVQSPTGNGNGSGSGNGSAPQPPAPGYTYQPPAAGPQYPEVAPDDSVFGEESPSVSEYYPTPDAAASDDMIILDGGETAAGTMASESLQWGKSLAIALVLLLCAAHLGTWTRRLRTARAGGPGLAPRVQGSAHARVEASRKSIEAALARARGGTPQDEPARKGGAKDTVPDPAQDTEILETEGGELVEELNLEYTPAVFPHDRYTATLADPAKDAPDADARFKPTPAETPADAPKPAPTPDPASASDDPATPPAEPVTAPDDSAAPSEPRQYDEALNAFIGIASAREPDASPDASAANLTEVLEHPRPRRRGLRLPRR